MNGSLATAILGGMVGDTLALLALAMSSAISFRLVISRRLPTRSRLTRVALFTCVLGIVEATVWSLTFRNAYDMPGSWCWTCNLILDALGEITENVLAMLLLGASLGVAAAMLTSFVLPTINRLLRSRSFRHIIQQQAYRRCYLRSAHWRRFRASWWQAHPHATCMVCHGGRVPGDPLDLHHVTYARRGHELFTDVRPVHRSEHKLIHGH